MVAGSQSLVFDMLCRMVADEARRAGFAVPVFKSPPAGPFDRSIRFRPDGGAVVAVRFRDRSWGDVAGDLVEGVALADSSAFVGLREAVMARLSDVVPPQEGEQ